MITIKYLVVFPETSFICFSIVWLAKYRQTGGIGCFLGLGDLVSRRRGSARSDGIKWPKSAGKGGLQL